MKSALVVLVTLSSAVAVDLNAEEVSFQRQVRGILSDKCFRCHGPDAEQRQAGLRLDEEASAKSHLESGSAAVVPGKIDESELVSRIMTHDADLVMPPADSGKSLTDAEKQILKTWIAEGANWGQHWAFVTISRPQAPALNDNTAAKNDIDRFVRHRLADQKLQPNGEADRVSLIRRVTLDLTGLPPTVAEVNAYLNDTTASAYETVVDRLLASPRYGEHMARYWLDAARYGDTHGLHLDNYREMWAYRDWVINALNANKPFDTFTIEQLAGDLLENPSEQQVIATGFNRCHVTTSEGGSIAEEVHVRNVVDRVVTTGTVFMGLTMDCTRCHDHKFDPLTMKDFYSFYAYFNSIDGPPLDGNKKDPAPVAKVMSLKNKDKLADMTASKATAEKKLNDYLTSINYVEPEKPSDLPPAAPVEVVWFDDATPKGAKLQGTAPWKFVKAPAPVFSGESSSTGTAEGLGQQFIDSVPEPLILKQDDRFFCYVHLDKKSPPKQIMLQWKDDKGWNHRAYWGGNHIEWGADNSPSRKRMGDLPQTGDWVRLEVAAADVGFKADDKITGWAFTQFDGTVHWDKAGIVSQPDQNRLFESYAMWQQAKKTTEGKTLPETISTILHKAAGDRTKEEGATLKRHFLEFAYVNSQATVIPLKKQIKESGAEAERLNKEAPTTLVYREAKEPKPAYMLTRGEYDQKGDAVERATPAVLPPTPDTVTQNRLTLARWLTSDDHPLTSRVTINRLWQQFFGTGLVKTTEDFGSQGEPPTHPQLLDWLSSEFMKPQTDKTAHHWDMKHMVRLIVTSATYRQSAKVTPEAYSIDPENRYLARGPRYRLDAEMLRDQALAVSGLLVNKVGGPSVKPPQPDGLWFAVGYSGSNTVRFKKDDGHEKVHRRTLYTFIKRTAPPPQMSTFDAPSRESCVVRRERTNSPLQALLLMNDPQFVECARALAERALTEGGKTADERARFMLQQCVLRNPTAAEISGLTSDFEQYLADYTDDPAAAKKLVALGEQQPAAESSAAELAAWTMVANLLLNLDEVINK